MHNAAALGLLVAVMAALYLLRRRLGLFWSASLFYAASFLYVRYGLEPPAPAAIVWECAGVAFLAVLLYVTSSDASRQAFWAPILALMVERRRLPLLVILMVSIPAAVAFQAYRAALPAESAPPRIRSVHPSPPSTIAFKPPQGEGRTIDLIKEDSPHADLESQDPAAHAAKVARGKVVYYENCFYCHGDHLAADGHYAMSLKPPPANFRDPGVLPMLESSFLFWRIAKGGPGLPDAGTPWDSGMPVWEKYLTEDDIWSVILFMADMTGFRPRAKEALAEGH